LLSVRLSVCGASTSLGIHSFLFILFFFQFLRQDNLLCFSRLCILFLFCLKSVVVSF
jgi:hypothetical protein